MKNPSNQARSVAKPGVALKALRRGHGWTFAEASRRTELPTSSLSKIENDKMSFTFDKLARISAGLHLDIAALFKSGDIGDGQSGPSGRCSIARAGEGKAIQTKNYAHLYPAWNLLNKSIIPIVAELRARSLAEFGERIRHPGEEYAFALEGEVDLYMSHYAPVRLKAGDSIYFDSGMGHAYVAASGGRCRVLSLCSASQTQLIAAPAGTPVRGRSAQAGGPHTREPPRLSRPLRFTGRAHRSAACASRHCPTNERKRYAPFVIERPSRTAAAARLADRHAGARGADRCATH
jgi:transcriptional regulator with XRE-family HTH domain